MRPWRIHGSRPVPVGAEYLCHQAIFVDDTTRTVMPPDPEMIQVGDAIWQRPQRHCLDQGAVRQVGVAEVLVLPQHHHQVALVPDQGPVQHLTPAATNPVGCQYSATAADLRRIESADDVMSHPHRYHRGHKASPEGAQRSTAVPERSMRGLCPLRTRHARSYGPCPPLERVPCAGPDTTTRPLTRLRWRSLHSGLDHAGPVFAPCLLGCPGTTR